LMPSRNGAEINHARPRPEIKKLPAYFKEMGYEVVAFGKVAHYKQTIGYGFDHFAHDTFHDHQAIPAALRWLKERRSDKPLCLFVGSNWPHVPWPMVPSAKRPVQIPPTLLGTFETLRAREHYYQAVEKMDAELGKVYDAVRGGLGTNTLFIHSSDHGAQFPFGKWNCYDAGIRVSFLAVWPGVIKPRSLSDAMVSWVDILPTLIQAGGGQPPENIDGRSFLPVLRGTAQSHRELIFSTHTADGNMNVYPIRAVRTENWKYIRNLHPEFKFATHIDRAANDGVGGYWGGYWPTWLEASKTNADAAKKVAAYHQRPAEELYDLSRDPHEQQNLAVEPSQRERLEKMRAHLNNWMKEQGDKGAVSGQPLLLSDEAHGNFSKERKK
jgi:N-sulfoglucosamine sulfohydrolase